ncbi:MAG: helix-turn-helix transcriptional regulator [Pseudomonadota bacterium]
MIKAIGYLYDAAIDPTLWERFMLKVGEIVQGQTGVLILNSHGTPAHHLKQMKANTFHNQDSDIIAQYTNFPEEHIQIYMERFFLEGDVWHTLANKNKINNEAFIGSELISHEKLRKTQFFKDCFNAAGPPGHTPNEFILGAVIDPTPLGATAFSMSRGGEVGDYTQEDKKTFEILIPHLQRARLIQSHNEELKAKEKNMREALDASVSAIVLLNNSGRAIYTNKNAEDILGANDGISCTQNQIRIRNPDDSQKYSELVASSIETSQRKSNFPGIGLQLMRPSGALPYRLIVTPLNTNSEQKRLDPLATAAVFIYDTAELKVPSASLLKELFNLTESEIKVAHLFCQCFDLRKIANELDVKISTVRTHFYRILEKSQTSSQPELMRLLNQLPRS